MGAAAPNKYDGMSNDEIKAYRDTGGATTGAEGAAARNNNWEANEIRVNAGSRQITLDGTD